MKACIAMCAAVALALIGCSGSDEDPVGVAEPETPEEADGSEEVEGDGTALGAWDDPLPAGETVPLIAWDLTIEPATQEDQGDETVWLMAEVTAVRTASEPDMLGSFDAGLIFTVMGSGGVEIPDTCLPDNDLPTTSTVAPGAEVSGLICSVVPQEEVDGAVWLVGQQGQFQDVYIATG